MLPKRARREQQQQQQAVGEEQGQGQQVHSKVPAADPYALPYEPLAQAGRLPATLTWRGTGADTHVYDQV